MHSYAELQVASNFSFLRGASKATELVTAAKALGHRAMALTDRNSLAGVVQAHAAARDLDFRLVVGARLDLTDGPSLLCWPTDRAAYGRLSTLLTVGMRRAPKGQCFLARADVEAHAAGQMMAVVPPDTLDADFAAGLADYRRRFGRTLSLCLTHRYQGDDARRLDRLAALAEAHGLSPLATNDVHYHHPGRRALQDVMTCIREHCTIQTAGWRLAANAERHLKPPEEMARLFHRHPRALARIRDIVEACTFSISELRADYLYPAEVGPGETPQGRLAQLTAEGACKRYPAGVPAEVQTQIDKELALIGDLGYASYFLTVYEIVRFANEQGILCQGRGSAANSAVCYCLEITSIDPVESGLLFERFISSARNEPPDIDVDFEHERREEVIQHIYEKYGRDHAAIAATVICYRSRGAVRDVGKAMGMSQDTVGQLSAMISGWGTGTPEEERAREAGLDPDDPLLRQVLDLTGEISKFPRHLSQHVGGFVITPKPLATFCPIMNAAMEDRQNIEWDKDDLDAAGLMKVDVLGLGMLSCLRRAFTLLRDHYGRDLTLATIPPDDVATYDMLCAADTLGVFQVESRAQMSMLPRLRPREFYDLVVQVAIVRPGPIQGGMVHPYLRRRQGLEPVDYPSEALKKVLKKTLGVPLFQEQAMQIAIVGAGFTGAEADALRRAMASFRKLGDIDTFEEKFRAGMLKNGYTAEFAERCFNQIKGFSTYGFPESHAASFAKLVYVSAWIKCHYPDVFACALLNSLPMGFYAPAQIVRDARDHDVVVLPPDVNHSDWDSRLESPARGQRFQTLRLGLRLAKGLSEAAVQPLLEARGHEPYASPHDLWRRARLAPRTLELLAEADAFQSMGLDRRQALWAVSALGERLPPLLDLALNAEEEGTGDPWAEEPSIATLPAMTLGEHLVEDYTRLSLSLKRHPMSLVRDDVVARLERFAAEPKERMVRRYPLMRMETLETLADGSRVALAGLVLVRQRPGSSKGVIFITLEDESGIANLVLMPETFTAFRRHILGSRLLLCLGRVEKVIAPTQDQGPSATPVTHVRAERLIDYSDLLSRLDEPTGAAPARRADATFPDGRNFR
ncbi:DNA polymerase III, alpha subunit [Nitrospirillum viridazoti Y2]|uniref:Error-prone DNA polymerase n=1 Tax=Nitrospirillum amazonense TaxID=28077 RepID=A0A560IXK9_9PROT|nr:error-prone DNA polymerase [Nitrospirillum amazonense]EGY01044.1 DNA polymerase III, alpha subunit [Nitrospirillum amazonense Y2]TWB63646.1 DnaE-like error-prone DNA polymerase [Nitrospirillum amazonense]